MSIIQCGGQMLDCNPQYWFYAPITLNSDVAGLGVLLSFIITAFITISVVTLAYVTDSLPEKTINGVDRRVLRRFRSLWLSIGRCLGFPPLKLRHRQARLQSIQRFVLSLSDQQLVTGFAVLIAGYLQRCTLSTWDFDSLLMTAWFSALTHMATLILLREYLHEHKAMFYWRVVAMFSMMTMLGVSRVFGGFIDSGHLAAMPVVCGWHQITETRWTANFYLPIISELLFLVSYYCTNFVALLMNRRRGALAWLLVAHGNVFKKESRIGRQTLFRQHSEELNNLQTHRLRPLTKVRRIAKTFRFIESFLWEVILMFMLFLFFTYGIYFQRWQVVSIWHSWGKEVQSSDALGFGQLVSLILIALPFLGLIDAYSGRQNFAPTGDSMAFDPLDIDIRRGGNPAFTMAPISANSHNEGFISLAVKENVGQEGVPAIPPRESMQAISPDRPVAGPLTGKPDEICDLEKDTPAVRTGDITSVTINPEQSSAVCSPPPINASGTQSESSAADIRTTRGRESILEAGINILITRTEDQQSQQFALPHAGILQQTYDDDPFSSATGFGASLAILLVCLIAGLGLSECWLSVIGFTLIPAYQSWTILGMAGLLLFISGIPSWE